MRKCLSIGALTYLYLAISTLTAHASYFEDIMANAPIWSVNTRIEKIPTGSYDYYRIQLEEDAFVTFTFDDPEKGEILLSLLENSGSSHGRTFAVMRTTQEDNNSTQTVQKIQLRAGTYYVRIDGPFGEAYNAVYKTIPLQASTDIEQNDTLAYANPIALNKTIKSIGSVGDEIDYYTFTINEPSKVTLRTGYFLPNLLTHINRRLHIDIYNEARNLYLDTMSTQSRADEDTEMLLPGKYYIKVVRSEEMYNPFYQFTIDAEVIKDPLIFKNSIFGTRIQAEKVVRGFLSRNDEYYFTLDHEKKLRIIVTTDSKQPMVTSLFALDGTKGRVQLTNFQYKEQNGHYFLTTYLQPGEYLFEPKTKWSQTEEVNYTVKYEEVTYRDVPQDYQYYDEIMYLSTKGIINGFEDGTFKPVQAITRKQVLTMLSRYEDLQLNPIRDMIQFKDVPRFSENYELIYPFYRAGIVDGNNGFMNITQNLTRAQLAKILVNTFDLQLEQKVPDFKDVSSTDSLYPYIQILTSQGITIGSQGQFMPNKPVSREHFSIFLHRTLSKIQS